MNQQENALDKSIANLSLNEEIVDSENIFTYVSRAGKQKRKNRKGRPNKIEQDQDEGEQLRRKIGIIENRKNELLSDKVLQKWLDGLIPYQAEGSINHAKSLKGKCSSALALGLGSVKNSRPAQVQLAFFTIICQRLKIEDIQSYDPIYDHEDFKILEELNIKPLQENKKGRHQFDQPTLVFMPHCTSTLYENLLQVNWSKTGLQNLLLCCNTLERYAGRKYEENARNEGEDLSKVSCIDRSLMHLIVHELPRINSGQLSDTLNDLAFQTFIPISNFLPYSNASNDCTMPAILSIEESVSFWTINNIGTEANSSTDPELL